MCLFIDLSKVFDTISHPLLPDTLQQIRIRGKSLKLLKTILLTEIRIHSIYITCSWKSETSPFEALIEILY